MCKTLATCKQNAKTGLEKLRLKVGQEQKKIKSILVQFLFYSFHFDFKNKKGGKTHDYMILVSKVTGYSLLFKENKVLSINGQINLLCRIS